MLFSGNTNSTKSYRLYIVKGVNQMVMDTAMPMPSMTASLRVNGLRAPLIQERHLTGAE